MTKIHALTGCSESSFLIFSLFFNLSIYFGILKIKQIKNNEIIIIKIFKFDY